MRRNLWSVAALAVVFALGTSATSSAGGARNVTITVRDAAGAPVADARVLIAADEMDAVGTTDAAGQVRVTTGSSRISVTASKGSASATVSSSAAQVDVALSGGGK